MSASFLSTLILLLVVIDPLGIVPLCTSLLSSVSAHQRFRIIIREVSIAFSILLLFMFCGKRILEFMHLSEISLSIAGGVILFIIALRMIFPHPEGMFGRHTTEPFIVPIAIPLLAGPSSLATVLLLVSREPDQIGQCIMALITAMIICALTLIFGDILSKRLGPQILTAIERLMGLILTAIAVQMLMEGIRKFIHHL